MLNWDKKMTLFGKPRRIRRGRALRGAQAGAVGVRTARTLVVVLTRAECPAISIGMATKPTTPAFMLLFRNGGAEAHAHLTTEQREHLTRQWNDWYEGLAAKGKVQHGQPLALNGRVVSGALGSKVTDGPYAEAKEVVAGYLFLTVADLDEATEIAKQCPGLPIGLTVEVRPLVDKSPVLEGVQGHAPE